MNLSEFKTYEIEIAYDACEAEQFCDWLIAQGHNASIGRSTGNYVNGMWASADTEANEVMNELWSAYCNS
jgi:uncharacterized protein CbrC (UPF0167 family)